MLRDTDFKKKKSDLQEREYDEKRVGGILILERKRTKKDFQGLRIWFCGLWNVEERVVVGLMEGIDFTLL